MSRIASVLTPTTLPAAELFAARLDGELFSVDEGWMCADEPDSADLRACAVAVLLPPSASSDRLIMMGLTAAWLHAATDAPPFRHEVCASLEARVGLRLPRRFVLRELALRAADECRIGPLRVTTPARTVFDLARGNATGNAELLAIDALVQRFGISPGDVTDGIRSRLPGAGLAVGRVASVMAQPVLGRHG